MGQAQQELGVASAAAVAAHGHGSLAAGEDHAGRFDRLAVQHHLAGDTGVDLGHFTGFAFQVAEDQRGQAGGTHLLGSGVEGLLGRCDQLEVAAGEAGITRFDRFRTRGLQPGTHVRGDFDLVAGEDRQGLDRGGRVGDGGAGGDHRGFVAGDVGNRVGVDGGRPAGLGQAAALDRREVLAHAVHLGDGGAGFQQGLVDRLLVLEGQALGGQGEQGRAAAGEQEDHPVGLGQAADQLQHALGGFQAGGVRHRVRGFHHFDLLAVGAVAVAGHHQAGDLALPFALDHFGHGRGGLAGADDDDAAGAIGGQVIGQHLARVGGGDGGGEEVSQEALRIEGHGRLRGAGFLLEPLTIGCASEQLR
ncbi:hypothetical protein D3C84_607030 [compost metagenome]